jgi:hypothetical protein
VDMVPDVGGPGAMKLGGAIVSRAVARRGGLASRRRLSGRQYAVALVVGGRGRTINRRTRSGSAEPKGIVGLRLTLVIWKHIYITRCMPVRCYGVNM